MAKENMTMDEMVATNQPSQVQGKQASHDVLHDNIDKLARFGGFNFLETAVDGIQNLNPERKARKKIFLTDEQKADERFALKKTIDLWIDMLTNSDSITGMLEACKTN